MIYIRNHELVSGNGEWWQGCKWSWQLNSHPHIDEIGGEAGFFVGADGCVIGGIDVEAEFGEVLRVRSMRA
jgi:hypothetical protein